MPDSDVPSLIKAREIHQIISTLLRNLLTSPSLKALATLVRYGKVEIKVQDGEPVYGTCSINKQLRRENKQ